GKFGYMAPEQLIRGGVVDHRTDIYAAGVVLFELLTNKRLYEAGPEPDYRALAKKVAKGEHTMPSEVDKVLAPYDDLVATALRPKSDDRYQTAAEFRDAIQQALVAVNPTISTDLLGSYMRDLFSSEMTAQRELHDRVAKAHLEDFQDELTKETGTTVSFAMANMPLQAPPEPGQPRPPRVAGRPTPQPKRPRPPTLPTDILPQQPPQPPPIPTAAVPTQELALADGTGAVPPEDLSLPAEKQTRKTKAPIVIGVVAALAALGAVLFVMVGSSDKPQQVAQTAPPKKNIVVEAISAEEQTPPKKPDPPTQEEKKIETSTQVVTPPTPPIKSEKTERKHHHQTAKVTPPPPTTTTPKPELTKEAVIAKYRQAKQAYDAYKQKNGGRYDADWNELATYQQYHPNDLEGFVQRIESFRAKLRE
ncbi:MAG TPA: hypothetical protein VL326_09370, partial [Kofleriaceae bacterium]|nr:hypothetical protein [Kofleriaceae bacterium]